MDMHRLVPTTVLAASVLALDQGVADRVVDQ
jgi:hypothetical protein